MLIMWLILWTPSVELCVRDCLSTLKMCPNHAKRGELFLSHAGFSELGIDAGLSEAAALIVLRPHTWVMNVLFRKLNMNWPGESLPKSTEEWRTHAC